ncbi:MAG TPA: NYN domain-containing protein [Phycisphaerae bacterium]|nr:NYN domain-containing protein [Phycisphaerae bacterium]
MGKGSVSKRSIIYIDGFNLYYGAVKGTKWKWLDVEHFFSMLRQDDDIQVIKYFTAEIDGPHRFHQRAYLLALATLPKIQIILGRFKLKQVQCRVQDCSYVGSRFFSIPEEKRTDVNIAVHMLQDTIMDKCDRLVVVSGDSDLVPAVNMVKRLDSRKKIIVYVPASNLLRGAAVELRSAADKNRTLPNSLLPKSQFPPRVPDGTGGWITKPDNW